jgi:hypothetical protein
MSGTDIIGQLLLGSAELLRRVPADRIKAGAIAPDISLPALLVRTESSVDRQRLKQGATIFSIERISVTVRAASYRDQVAIIRLVRAACTGERRAIAGATNVSVRTAGKGPDMPGPAKSFEQAQDFRVSFDAPD